MDGITSTVVNVAGVCVCIYIYIYIYVIIIASFFQTEDATAKVDHCAGGRHAAGDCRLHGHAASPGFEPPAPGRE